MAELLLSAVLPVLFEKLTSPELLKFATQEGVRSKLNKLKETLELIDSLLIDAERKQLTNTAVKNWLDKLQDWAYDAEDILDEYATEALRRKLKIEEHQASTSRPRKLIPARFIDFTPKALWSDMKMSSKIADITKELEDLCKKRTQLGLVEIAGGEPTASTSQRRITSSIPTEPVIYGRENDTAKIIEMVLNDEPGRDHVNFDVISIVAMGGAGKTTLAREVYNDEALNEFNPKGWVCVSDDFDVLKISKAILESITGRSSDVENLDAVQRKIKEEVVGRKFLLVLDDIWSKSYSKWEVLRSPFMFGAQGSKIIVTTRLDDVASTMGSSSKCHRLKLLSDDECWSLFANHAFDKGDMDAHPGELIRQKVIEKCSGLPLAAKTLGGLLRSKRVDDWLHILDTNICDLQDGEEIPAALLLSYYHLPSHLKKCFAYCALFPKAYVFEKDEVVFLWLAEGFIQQSGGNKQLEDLGGEFFQDLLSRSIFQTTNNQFSRFIMHDLVNDLAQMVSRKVSCRWVGKQESNSKSKLSEKTRYSSYVPNYYNVKSNFEVLKVAKHLRTHLSFTVRGFYFFSPNFISNSVVSELLLKFKKLRVLSLKGYRNFELPNSIGGLRLLRYLNLSYTSIRSLPESINSMCNLQTLLLGHCYNLLKLSDMGNLINLPHFDILDTYLLEEMPLGVSKWKCLRVLSNFIVSKDSGSSLKDLEDLKLLCGRLDISRLEYATKIQVTQKVILSDKEDLKVLLLEWGFDWKSRDEGVESHDEEVLNMLKPHRNLEKLTIKGYEGINFSSWVGDSSFSEMTILKLIDCRKCTALPSLGLLSSLKYLTIQGMKGIKNIDSEFYGNGRSKPFPSLETLLFINLQEWESWNPVQENESFSKLHELRIVNCPKLRGRLPNNLPSLKKLEIKKCNRLVVLLSNISKLCELWLSDCKKIVCSSIADYKSLVSMTLLNIDDCKELVELPQNDILLENPPQGLHTLISLKKLEFGFCDTLTTLLEGIIQQNPHLEELSITGCECDSLDFIFRGQLPQSLKKLSVAEHEVVFQLSDANEPIISHRPSSSSSTSLIRKEKLNARPSHVEDLTIEDCPSLTCLPIIYQLSATLTRIFIWRCSKLTTLSSTGHLPVTLKHLQINECSELTTILAEGHLPETLETLYIWRCDKLESIIDKFYNNKAFHDKSYCNLHRIDIIHCQDFTSFPEGGFPDSNLSVGLQNCPNLKDLPNGIPTLSSLETRGCPNLSFPEERLPTKLERLMIEGLKHYKAVMKWELSKLTSLHIIELPDEESLREEDMRVTLPQTLTKLHIEGFRKLKCLPFKDFECLPSLECLRILNCPELASLPKLPSSLMILQIDGSPLFKEACKRDNKKQWAKIADMPVAMIDDKFVNELEEEA